MPPSGYFVSASGLPWAARCVSLVIPAGDRQVLDPGSFEALKITVHTPSCQHLPLISVKPSKAPQPTAMSRYLPQPQRCHGITIAEDTEVLVGGMGLAKVPSVPQQEGQSWSCR